ncbi:MAG: hypothetical protein IPI49_10805 [Myxococcales bacterium]|nr:hypothetical protein [Myxococcales bacterium]
MSTAPGSAVAAIAAPIAAPNQTAGLTSASVTGLGRPRRGPLIALLAFDAGLAIAGALLLRSGLAGPAAAATTGAPPGAPAAERAPATSATPAPPPAPPPPPPPGTSAISAAPATPAAADADAPAALAAAPVTAEPALAGADGASAMPSDSAEPAPPPPVSDKKAEVDAKAKKKSSRKGAESSGGRADAPMDPYDDVASMRAQVDQLLRESQGNFDRCYASVYRGTAAAGPVKLAVSLKVLAGGSLGITIGKKGDRSDLLADCVRAELARWSLHNATGRVSPNILRVIRFQAAR